MEAIYYGKISKEVTEWLMERCGKDGSYLLRDSETVTGAFCLCVRRAPFVLTYRIEQSAHGWAVETVSGSRPQYFQTVEELLQSYRASSPRNMEPLQHPLDKTQLSTDAMRCLGPDYWEM